jgi:hypothetical protein
MLELLEDEMNAALRSELKSSFYAQHLSMVEAILKQVKAKYPGVSLESVAVKLTEAADKHAGQIADCALAFKKEMDKALKETLGENIIARVKA